MDETFLQMLRCPVSGGSLKLADDDLLRRASEAQVSGHLRDRQGLEVGAFEVGLVSEDGCWFYAVRNDIPSLIPDQAVDVSQLNPPSPAADDETP